MKLSHFTYVAVVIAWFLFAVGQTVKADEAYNSWSEKDLLKAGQALSTGNILTASLKQYQSEMSSNKVNFYVTNFGVNQWKPEYKTGDTFANLPPQQHYSGVPGSGQILVVMPPDKELFKTNLTDEIFDTLKARVDGGLAVGTKNFEIRLVDHINLKGYLLDAGRQEKVNRFDYCSHQAIVRLNNYLENKNSAPSYQFVLASDGAEGFSKNIAVLEPCSQNIKRVTYVDARASKTDVINAINVLKAPEKFCFLNTKGDAAGLIGQSISVHDVSKDIKRQFPGVQLYLLDNRSRPNIWTEAHESSIWHPADRFLVKEVIGQGYSIPKELTGQGIKEQILGIFPLQRSAPTALPNSNIVNLNTVKTPEIWQAGMGYIGPETLKMAIPNVVQQFNTKISPILPQTFTTPTNRSTNFNDWARDLYTRDTQALQNFSKYVTPSPQFNDWARELHRRDTQALQNFSKATIGNTNYRVDSYTGNLLHQTSTQSIKIESFNGFNRMYQNSIPRYEPSKFYMPPIQTYQPPVIQRYQPVYTPPYQPPVIQRYQPVYTPPPSYRK